MTTPLALVSLMIAFAAGAFAQATVGSIRGVVTSPDGPVGGGTIQATHQATGKVYVATSAKSGQFALQNLPEGTYDVVVPDIGLATVRFTRRGVVVERGKATTLDIQLAKGNLNVVGDDNAYLLLHNKYANITGPAPRTRDGHPDFSGVWNRALDPNPSAPTLLPWAQKEWTARLANALRDDPSAFCLPEPTLTIALLSKVVQTPGLLLFLFEDEPHYRQVFLDGRSHPADPDPTWMGHSIGRWEKDTLVVDTIGFNDKSWLIFATGLPHTEMLHMTERYRRPDRGHLMVDLTLDDPGAFSKPIERHATWELAPGEEILESICNENNRYRENAGIK